MPKFNIRYATENRKLATVEARELSYSGGDGVVVAVFKEATDIVAIAALQPGMIVEKE